MPWIFQEVNTEYTLLGFQEFYRKPAIKDQSNIMEFLLPFTALMLNSLVMQVPSDLFLDVYHNHEIIPHA